jgi:hypothetical protein
VTEPFVSCVNKVVETAFNGPGVVAILTMAARSVGPKFAQTKSFLGAEFAVSVINNLNAFHATFGCGLVVAVLTTSDIRP